MVSAWDVLGGGGPTFSQYAMPFGSLSPGWGSGGTSAGVGGGTSGMPLNIMPQAAQTAPSGMGQIASAGTPPSNIGMPQTAAPSAGGGNNSGMNQNMLSQLAMSLMQQKGAQNVAPQMQFYRPQQQQLSPPTGMLGY